MRTLRLRRRSIRLLSLFAVVALLAVLPAIAEGQTPPAGPSGIAATRNARHPKLDSLLNDLADRAETQDPASVARAAPTSRGASVAVRIRPAGDPKVLATLLSALGALPANVGSDVIEAYVPVTLLKRVADLPAVTSVRTIIPPQPDLTVSQGAALHNTPNWNAFGFTGTGVKVGIIDVGFGFGANNYDARQAAGEVPAPAAVRCWTGVGAFTSNLSDCEVGTQHGAAVAETIIDEAPNASLYLSNPGTQADLLATVQWMASQGVQIINHSVSWTWDGPGDGTSTYSNSPLKAVDAAAAAGIVWINSAGNANQYTWTGAYSDANTNNFLDFSPSVDDNNVVLSIGQTVVIQARWTDPWGAPLTDLDILLYNPAGTTIVASSTLPQSGGPNQDPFEILQYTPPSSGTYHVRVGRFSGPAPAQVQIQVFNGVANFTIQTSGHSIANPAESANVGMLAVGAANWNQNPGNIPTAVEAYSSQGPTNDNRSKPDIVGADCGSNVTYGSFCGTSQASPHLAGMAALLLQKSPGLTPAQIVAQLKAWATDRGAAGADNTWGAGFAQLQAIAGKLTFTTQPSNGTAGAALPTQPKVEIQNSAGVTDAANNTAQVTLSISGGGTLTCTGGLSKQVAAGVAQFVGCSVTPAGSGYVLTATPDCFCLTGASTAFTIAAGASKLAFTAQPSNGITNTNLASQPVVTVQDSVGATVTGDNATQVTLSLVAGTGLSCTAGLTATASSGVATFAGCKLSATGSYAVHATSTPALTPADSAPLTVTGPPDHLSFTTQPVGAAANSALPTQPVVTIKDSANATVVADQTTVVTLAKTAGTPSTGGPGTPTCSGGVLTKTAVNGVATFSGCLVNAAGVGYRLHATSGSLTADDSALFNLFGAATKLGFTQLPASGSAGQPFPMQPIVAIQDALGLTVTTDTSTVALTLLPSGTLTCTGGQSKAAVAGLATFAGCNAPAGTYQLHAAATAKTPADSASFTVFSSLGTEWYFAEGFTGSGWNTSLHLLNANAGVSANVHVVYLLDSGSPVSKDFVVLPQRAFVIDANNPATGPGPNAAFGVHITSDIPIVAEEQMAAGASGDFAHGTQGATALSTSWYFAEGFTQFGWQTFVLVANPGASSATVTVTYQVQGGAAVVKSHAVAAGQRWTFAGHVDVPDQAFSVSISSTQPIVAEMAMYEPASGIAHRAVGVTQPATNWYLGEGFTGAGWQTFISVGNPGNNDAIVTAVYTIDGASPVTKQITVAAHSRGTFIAHDPGLVTGPGPNAAFGVHVSSTQPIVVQEVLIDPAAGAARANSTMAAPALNARWSFSGGSSAAGTVSFYTVSNPNASAVSVSATYYFDDATSPVVQTINIPASSRGTFATLGGTPAVPSKAAVGVIISSTGGAVVAQEAVYDEAAGRAYSSAGAPG